MNCGHANTYSWEKNQAKALMAKFNIRVQRGKVADNPEEAFKAAAELKGKLIWLKNSYA